MICIKCKKNYEDHTFLSKPQIESYDFREIRKEKATGKLYAVNISAALCHSCLKEKRIRYAKRSLVYWLIFCIIFFLSTCAIVWLLSGGDGSLETMLTFPYILIPLIPFLMTPLAVWLRYRHPSIPRALIAEARIGQEIKTREEIESLSYEDLLHEIRKLQLRMDSWRGEDGEKAADSIRALDSLNEEGRVIGVELNRRGGKKLMLQAHRDADAGRAIEFSWDGVGEWRG